jgi:hypothetical protein
VYDTLCAEMWGAVAVQQPFRDRGVPMPR